MSSVLIIGYGNTLRSDDGAGIRAAEILARRHPDFTVLCVHQLTPELAEVLSQASLAIFLDAVVTSKTLTEEELTLETTERYSSTSNTHFFTPQLLLALASELYGTVPHRTFVLGIPAYSTVLSEELSTETLFWVEKAAETVERIVERFLVSHC